MQRHVVLGHSKAEPICVGGAGQHVLDVADRNACRSLPGVVALVGIIAALVHADAQRGAGVIHRCTVPVTVIVVFTVICRGIDAHLIQSLPIAAEGADMADVDLCSGFHRRAVRRVDIIIEHIGIVRI